MVVTKRDLNSKPKQRIHPAASQLAQQLAVQFVFQKRQQLHNAQCTMHPE